MSAPFEGLLVRASHGMLGSRGPEGPVAIPMVYWSDGTGLWMPASSASVKAAGLDADPACVAYIPPLGEGEPGEIVRGQVRIYGMNDPLGFMLHTPTISAAMTALALRNAGTVLGRLQDAARIPPRLPRPLVVLRFAVEGLRTVDPPDIGPGVAPALPTDVPADVRRAIAGVRRVVLVYADEAGIQAAPAVWGAGYALTTPPSLTPPAGSRAVAAVDVALGPRGSRAVGLAVHGTISSDGRLEPDRATSWFGADTRTVEVAPPAPGGVTLPD